MSFTRLIGQEAVKKRLAQEITGNPCHASVFTGVKGIGKHEFAHEYAKALLCSEPTSDGACGHCNNCRYIEAKTHPDFIILEPEKGSKGILCMGQVHRDANFLLIGCDYIGIISVTFEIDNLFDVKSYQFVTRVEIDFWLCHI